MTNYRYFLSGSPTYHNNAKDFFVDSFQALLWNQFYNAPDVHTIQEETVFGSGSYVDVTVRVNKALNTVTGQKLGDDFKIILFPDLTHATGIGYMYYFDDNYWLVTFSETIKNLAASCMVRRCNNTLRWIGDDGIYYTQYCAIDYEISRPRDAMGTENPVIPAGYISVYTQFNDKTKLIKANQRFLFGSVSNRVAFKVFGDGVRNFLNQKTTDDESSNVLFFSMGGNFINKDKDNLTLGIADYYTNLYDLTLSPATLAGKIGDTYQLQSLLSINSDPATRPLTYVTSASSKATISGSGLATLVSAGSAIITCYMTDNATVSASAVITISASATSLSEVRILPVIDYVLESETTTFTSYVYTSGCVTGDAFTFAVSGSVPVDHYVFTTVSNNSFSVENVEKYLDDILTVTATSGSYTGHVDLELRGAW